MDDTLEFENGLLSFANPNYQLDPADINSNLEVVEDYEDLYEELDTVCRYNRRSGVKSRKNYAQLDPASMGVKVDPESVPILTADSDNNVKQNLHSKTVGGKRYHAVDNDCTDVNSNDNKEMGRKSGFLDYYISVEASSWHPKDASTLLQNIHSSNTTAQSESSTGFKSQNRDITVGSDDGPNCQNVGLHHNSSVTDETNGLSDKKNSSFKDQQMPLLCNIPKKLSTNHNPKCVPHKDIIENDALPSGWEKHEDDSGPYYWHISSGTIQREPPMSCGTNGKIPTQIVKEMDMISSISDFSLKSCKVSSPILPGLSDPSSVKSQNTVEDNKLKRRSYPEGSCNLTSDKRLIRFAVRSLGWVEIAEDDLTPEKSSKAVNKCIVDLSKGRNDILDVVGRWGDGKDLFMDLDDYSLRLMATQDLTILNTQPIHTIRVWGVGRDNGRDFAYVARDRVTRKYMCHVFRCDIPARIIANTLRDICKKIMIERSLQHNLAKQIGPSAEVTSENCSSTAVGPTRPTNLPTEQRRFLNSDCQSSYKAQTFPTPMEEPKKVLKVHYLGTRNVDKATGVEVLNDAIEQLSMSVSPSEYKFVNVAVAPSTITISEPGDSTKMLAECRVRFLSFLGIGKNIKHCGFIVHTAQDQFVAHVFYCEPSSGALCKTIEAACKLRYQKCLDAHREIHEKKFPEAQGNKGLATTIRSFLGSIGRLTKSTET